MGSCFFPAVADIPGLVPDAHLNRGLGHSFLRHIQRCSALLLVLDSAETWGTDMSTQLRHLRQEMELYDDSLLLKTHMIVANKMDAWCEEGSECGGGKESVVDEMFEAAVHQLHEETGLPVMPVSALKFWNIRPLKEALFRIAGQLRST